MKKILLILVVLLGVKAYGQGRTFYSFCDKSGDISMTWDEFSQCKKELTSTDANLMITSFIVSIKANDVFSDYECKGNVMSAQALEAIEKFHADKKFEGKILIEQVMVKGKQSTGERKMPGMVITIK